jgi:hypothetical protein
MTSSSTHIKPAVTKWIAVTIPLLLSITKATAQNTAAEISLSAQFQNYTQAGVQEKIYLHSDKSFYLTGEICWFKLYCVNASSNRPLNMSKVAYIEIINEKNNPVLQAKISIKNGFGDGSFQLPAKLASGKYKIRSYTNWMKNFSANFFFEKEITIINPQHFSDSGSAIQKSIYTIQFFPEGGNLVNGIESKIAFRATDQHNKGAFCEGFIINNRDDTLLKFHPLKFGIGNFLLTPQTNEIYKAVTVFPGCERVIQDLPIAFDKGYVINVADTTDDKIRIGVHVSDNNNGQLFCFVQTRGLVRNILTNTTQNNYAEFLVDKNKLGEGISQFTIFNAAKNPMCERLYFIFPPESLKIGLTADKQEYGLRKKIRLHIDAGLQNGLPLSGNFSLAVYMLDSQQKTDATNIQNYLLLASDLAGAVESPDYYFTNNDAETEQAVDNLMLTQGWRRFRWEDILQNRKPLFHFVPEYSGHIITGKIVDSTSGIAAQNTGVYISSPGTRTQFHTAQSDSNGLIHFEMKDFYTDGELVIQTKNQRDSFLTVEINNPFSDKFSDHFFSGYNKGEINAKDLMNHNVSTLVQNKYNEASLNKFLIRQIDTMPFFGKPDVTYLLDNYVRFTTMEEVLREYVAPVSLKISDSKYELKVWDKQKEHVLFESNPLVLLDGLPVFDFNRIIRYDPLKVRKLDIITQTYYYGNMAYDGILNFETYSGHLQGFELDPHSMVIDYEGLQLQREFYSPAYDNETKAGSRLPDFRTLLYWAPEIITTTNGEKEISFYSSDIPGNFAAEIQGISADGKTGTKVIELKIKE